jgi:CheY-like chemotaxis protein/DNA-directed RNA polymerase specialized sigma24 family protein
MSDTLALAELRNLRRYAYCILGNRRLSDIAVEAALNSLVSDVKAVSGRAISRLDLYRKVNEAAVFSSSNVISAGAANGLHAQFQRLSREQRQIAALRAVVGLPYSDIASIMDKSEKAVRQTYCEALLRLREKPAAVLIIEDEVFIALDIQQIVQNLGFSVAGIAKNRAEALRIAGLTKPKLILADYRLRDETGVDVVKAIREQLDTSVIYVTSHPDEVARACDGEQDLVIAKPFNPRALAAAVQTRLAA